MLDLQLEAGRRMHAADLTALLCQFPELSVKVVREVGLVGLKPAAGYSGVVVGPAAVGWPNRRRVPIDFTAVHISPSGEPVEMLWAGKDAKELLGEEQTDQPWQVLKPQVIGFDGAVTTLELLPAIINSPEQVAAELLTCPAMDAVMLAKWKLVRYFWWLEFVIFIVVVGLYVAHAVVEDHGQQTALLTASVVSTLPLFWIEWRQFTAGSAMRGVGSGRLSNKTTHLDLFNILDLLGLVLVFVTGAVLWLHGRSSTLIAYTVLLLCWKAILYLRLNPQMGFLMA